MSSVFKSLASFLALISFLLISSQSPLQAQTKDERERIANIAIVLSGLRDQLADDWASTLKLGWDAYDIEIAPDGTVRPSRSTEEFAAVLEGLLMEAPAEERAKIEKLFQTIYQLPQAEKAYAESIMQARNAMAQTLLSSIGLVTTGGMINDMTDRIVKGSEPIAPLDSSAMVYKLKPYGFRPQIPLEADSNSRPGQPDPEEKLDPAQAARLREIFQTIISEIDQSPPQPSEAVTPPQPTKVATPPRPTEAVKPTQLLEAVILPQASEIAPSSDPEALRSAYEACRAWSSLYLGVRIAMTDIQLAMYSSDPGLLPTHFSSPEIIEQTMEVFRHLPGLSPQESRVLDNLPTMLKDVDYSLSQAAESLARKDEARAKLEEATKSALRQTSELRDYYIRRLSSR